MRRFDATALDEAGEVALVDTPPGERSPAPWSAIVAEFTGTGGDLLLSDDGVGPAATVRPSRRCRPRGRPPGPVAGLADGAQRPAHAYSALTRTSPRAL